MFRAATGPSLRQTGQAFAFDGQSRGYATLKDISMRLKSVKNIQKITQSMKMVAAAKYAQAERGLRPAKPYGEGAQGFYQKADLDTEKKPENLMLLLTSDRGLCGGVHSSIVKMARNEINEEEKDGKANSKLILVGDKSRAMLQRTHNERFIATVNDIGRTPPTFEDASVLGRLVLESGYKFESGDIYYNQFRTVVSYNTLKIPIYSLETVKESEKLSIYDSIDDDVIQSYMEFSMASLIYYALKEGAASEQSSRMSAMDAASKNASEMIEKLTLVFNRTRQAVITRELIEIISGAAAL